MARMFDPSTFGAFVLYLAIGNLLLILGTFGTDTSGLRTLAAAGDRIRVEFRHLISFRLKMSAIVLVVAGIVAAFFLPIDRLMLLAVSFAIALSFSTLDFFFAPLRATLSYETEFIVAGTSSLAVVGAILTANVLSLGILETALLYFVGVCASLGIAYGAWRNVVRSNRFEDQKCEKKSFLGQLRENRLYTVDGFLSSAINQLDTILVAALLGQVAAGLYQFPAKVMKTGVIIVQIATAIYMPLLARAESVSRQDALYRRMTSELILLGFMAGLGISIIMPMATPLILEGDYEIEGYTWAAFGVALAMRLFAASPGIMLVFQNRPGIRVIGQAVILGVFCLSMLLVARPFGLTGVALSFGIAMLFAAFYYHWRVKKLASDS